MKEKIQQHFETYRKLYERASFALVAVLLTVGQAFAQGTPGAITDGAGFAQAVAGTVNLGGILGNLTTTLALLIGAVLAYGVIRRFFK